MPSPLRPPLSRLTVTVFVGLFAAAMAVYPGWNRFDHESDGHDFLRNFLCDLLSATTPDGRSNARGAALMSAAVLALTLGGLLPLWWRACKHGPCRALGRVLGLAAAALTVAICAEQALGLRWPHHAITLSAGALGLVPTAMAAAADWCTSKRAALRRTLLLVTLAGAMTNFVSYALVQLGSPLTLWVPVSQKIALCGLLAWLAMEPLSSSESRQEPPPNDTRT